MEHRIAVLQEATVFGDYHCKEHSSGMKKFNDDGIKCCLEAADATIPHTLKATIGPVDCVKEHNQRSMDLRVISTRMGPDC